MKTNHTITALTLLLTISATLLAQPSFPPGHAPKTLNILFIGNSYTYVNNLDIVLKNLALSAQPKITINTKRIVKGGASLERHYNDPETLTQIRNGEWDYIILQEQSLRPAIDPEKFYTYARKLQSEIQKTEANTVFFMTWARQNKPDMIEQLSTAYSKMAKELKVQAAPVGLAWDMSLKRKPELILHSKDGSHPNQYGTYLAACVFYATLTRQSPVGLSNAGMEQIGAETAKYLQKVAWEAVEAYQKSTPVPVIFDTDMDSDVDDVGALAVLHALTNKGQAEILGVIVTSDDMYSPLCADAINTCFNRPDIPIGVNHNTKLRSFSKYTKGIAQEFDHDLQSYSKAQEAASLYRNLLSSQPDNSVVIITVGHLTSLKNLLVSTADTYSQLDGIALVKKKVKLWSCMGGKYPKGKEPNFYRPDSGSTEFCVNNWPTPVVFSGAEIGNPIKTGGQYFKERAALHNPVRRAYELYNNFQGRSSWDQTAVLYRILGNQQWWTVHSEGYNYVFPDGSNEWRTSHDKDHSYLVQKMEPGELSKVIDMLMLEEQDK